MMAMTLIKAISEKVAFYAVIFVVIVCAIHVEMFMFPVK